MSRRSRSATPTRRSCGAFDDNFAGSGSARTTEFDNRLTTKVITTEIDTNSVTDKSIRVHSAYTYRAYADGSWRSTARSIIGGGGSSKLIHDTGTVRFDPDGNITKVAGPHTVLTGGLQPFCDALGRRPGSIRRSHPGTRPAAAACCGTLSRW